ncbi:MAG TPA: MarR family transcriptional regulator [Polyangiaceae bacterium]|nr:MarR family transcriptional regulator [Polyangiaceae bacterium]
MKDSTDTASEGPEQELELEVADTVGRLMHFWGFKRPMGRIWTVLYLSAEPLSAQDLSTRLKMSAGAVSMALAELEKWGAVARSWLPGERRDYFKAEPSIWKLVQRVLRERELGLVRNFEGTLSRALAATDDESGYKRARLQELHELTRTGGSLLEALVSGGAVDPTVLAQRNRNP